MNKASTKPLQATADTINAAADRIRQDEVLQRLTQTGDFKLTEVDASKDGTVSYQYTMRSAAAVHAAMSAIMGWELKAPPEPAFPCRMSKAEMLARTEFLASYAPYVGWVPRVRTNVEALQDHHASGDLVFDEAALLVAHAETDIAQGGACRVGLLGIGTLVEGGTVTGTTEIDGFPHVIVTNGNGLPETVSPYLVRKLS